MPMPTLDERIASLTMTLELAIHQQRDHDRIFQEDREAIHKNADAIRQLTSLVAQDVENIRSLACIAEAHEHRLDRIQG